MSISPISLSEMEGDFGKIYLISSLNSSVSGTQKPTFCFVFTKAGDFDSVQSGSYYDKEVSSARSQNPSLKNMDLVPSVVSCID